ncbi:helix-turn-helix domain-containing protein [Dactylosporangium sp. CA-052675]|uniref:helix-turn-helix domain-containing protein n=1 Tax=Dactylosporangium sp. CA-052675 TaxID=3239927 RepID=UPI003D8D355C
MTGRWRPLPDSLEPEVAYLVQLLRQLKDRSGLSLAALAAKTTYSKSSWERYLNARTPPPRPAVEALARLTGEPVDRLVALWERAEVRWSGRAEQAPPATSTPQPATGVTDEAAGAAQPLPRARGWLLAAAAVCVLIGILVALATPLGITGPPDSPAASAQLPIMVGCHGAACAGRSAYDMACDVDAASFADLQVGPAYVELRISDRCAAAWARISHSALGDQVQVVAQDGRAEALTVSDTASTDRYLPTRMIPIDRHSHVRACIQPASGTRHCSPWGTDHPVPVPPRTHTASPPAESIPAAARERRTPSGSA